MQDNPACFEAWALALKHWCKTDSVTLEWEVPEAAGSDRESRTAWKHYERFLYRVEQFRSLFPEWFKVSQSDLLLDAKALGEGPLFLNVAGKRTAKPSAMVAEPTRNRREHELEHRLLVSGELAAHYKMGASRVPFRQLPVGLFKSDPPQNTSAVFPGAKSAIDLLVLDGTTLWLFELKAEKNIPVGTITELLFYTSVLRDAASGRFSFAAKKGSGSDFSLAGVNTINGVMLGHELHPLLDDPAIFIMLNKAVASRWQSVATPAVTFHAGQLTEQPFRIRDCKDSGYRSLRC